MNISKLLSSDHSSPLESIQGAGPANPSVPLRSSRPLAVAPQDSVTWPVDDSSELEDPPSPSAIPANVDAHVAAFLKSVLGSRKWQIFTSKLCERKDGGSPNRAKDNEAGPDGSPKGKTRTISSLSFANDEDGVLHGGTSPCAIAFLVKVEIVKEVLRNYVPNPYSTLKIESHQFPPAPGGMVHLTRAAVLSLCQWSNTQFAYWSRRSEAVSVMAQHDSGLQDLFYVLYQRLYQRDPPSHAFASYSPPTSVSWSSTASSSGSPPPLRFPAGRSAPTSLKAVSRTEPAEVERRLRVARRFTGKGLDGTITEIKRRTGASQFLRGRQSSLDPFGAHLESGGAAYDPNWPVIMPAAHGKHGHSRTSSLDLVAPNFLVPRSPARSESLMGSPMQHRRLHEDASDAAERDSRPASAIPGPGKIDNMFSSRHSLRGTERNEPSPSRGPKLRLKERSYSSSSQSSLEGLSLGLQGSFRDSSYEEGRSERSRGRGFSTGYHPYSSDPRRTKLER